MKRNLYIGGAVLLATIAALLTLRAQHTVPVVVAAHDLRAGVLVSGDDVQVVRMHDDNLPAGTVASTDLAVGRYVAWPLTAGEPVISGSLSSNRSGAAVTAGLDIPTGYSAIAVPVQPAAAVGGMLVPGDHVDVYATVSHTAASDGSTIGGSPADAAKLLGHDVLVVQLRNDQGQTLPQPDSTISTASSVHGLNFGSGKLGSVVIAVPAADVAIYAGAANTQVIYLALSVN